MISEKFKKIKLAAFDIDGVMTDGSLIFDENGVEYKIFNAKDGQGIKNLQKAGIEIAIITARNNGTVRHRAKILDIKQLYEGQKNKENALNEILKKNKLALQEIAYMGDDLPDICVLKRVGLACCPNDAVEEVKEVCDFVSSKNGGKGAVREFCDLLVKNSSSMLK